MLEAQDYRGMSYIEEKFEGKQLRHFSSVRIGLKIPGFPHIAPAFRMQCGGSKRARSDCA